MDHTKVLDKIKKCLALGKSPNEHEAAAAMRQAQKLMAAHDISERELGAIGYSHETVKTTIQCGKVVPVTLTGIVQLVRAAFGIEAVIARTRRETDYNYDIEYFGPEHRVVLAGYAHVVIQRAVDGAWKAYLLANPQMKGRQGARAGFYLGWIQGVRETVEDFVMPEDERLGTKSAMDLHYGRDLGKAEQSKQKVYGSTMSAGSRASEGFQLHRPVSTARKLIGC